MISIHKIACIIICLCVHTGIYASTDTAHINRLLQTGKAYRTSNPDSGIILGAQTLKMSESINYTMGVLSSYNNIGMSYWSKGDFTNGLKYMHLMIKEATAAGDSTQMGNAYGNCAILYIDMGDRPTGLSYSKKAIDILNSIGDSISTVHYINNIGWIYYATKKYDSAIMYYEKAIEGYNKYFEDKSWMGQAYANISEIYYELDSPAQTLNYAEKALAICRLSDYNLKATGHAYLSVSKAHLLGKRYNNCIRYADTALHIAETKNIHTLTAEAYWLKYKANEMIGRYKTAIQFLELNRKWMDSLLNEETNSAMADVKMQLATEKKDKEIAQKEKELAEHKAARQRNLFYLILALLAAAFTGVTAYQVYKRQQLRINAKNKQLEIEQKEKELAELNLKNQELKNEELNKELLSFTITTTQKNQLLQDISEELNNLQETDPKQVRKVKHIIQTALGSEEEWQEFKTRFEQVHQSFFDNIKADYPQLSANDLRLCAFIKLNLSSKQIASLLNIAPSSVDISKYRLKKKLGLEKEDNITDCIIKY